MDEIKSDISAFRSDKSVVVVVDISALSVANCLVKAICFFVKPSLRAGGLAG